MITKEQNADVGIIIARFQSPFLHEGHQDILNNVIKNHSRVIVYLGLSPLKCTFCNPLDFAARKSMIEAKYPDVEVYYIDDVGNNEVWSKNLDRLIARAINPNLTVVLYGSRDSFINAYMGKYPTVELVPTKFISASEIRKQIGIKAKSTQEFREGVIYTVENQYSSFKPTVDLAIINNTTDELLLARKPNQSLLRFPGGFMDPTQDKCAEDAAIREGLEETGLVLTVNRYVCSMIVDDWRYRREKDKIMTFFFVMNYTTGTPDASDDIEYVCWKSLKTLNYDEIVPEHRPLLTKLYGPR